ncbi:MAG: hemerythrin domain-containing protein [Bacteroidia bacterium]
MPLTLAELAIHIPAAVELFEKYDFNYYENGTQNFKTACTEKGLVFEDIDAELNSLQSTSKASSFYNLQDMSIERLIDFINGQYHNNEAETLAVIHTYIQQLITDANDDDDELLATIKAIEINFVKLQDTLLTHCKNEDKILFPYLRKLNDLHSHTATLPKGHFNSVAKNPIRMLEAEHTEAATILMQIKKTANNYIVPPHAPEQYATLMQHLQSFEKDLHMHLHLENNILFPKFIAAEQALTK